MRIPFNNIDRCHKKIKKHAINGVVSIAIYVSYNTDSICAL